ncbi:MAG TPA: alkaline phosphatase PhoX [Tahibacter sp.]|uniref:alkaline phosphatase PhoX n=1 Tax=Tahibacter sp. TaxID=2056211 RepID=UPI002B625152|nr:alkaline phosphatase PhoX [Tahibacter sp.]HSX61764.1 alkaline phosphatase PhoX [Tahibacter sp.]
MVPALPVDADGSGSWLALDLTNARIASSTAFKFASVADVVANARLAADAVGATRMDRPVWCTVNPRNADVYFSLTNNKNQALGVTAWPKLAPDAANPRAYADDKNGARQSGNVNGHIVRTSDADPGDRHFAGMSICSPPKPALVPTSIFRS